MILKPLPQASARNDYHWRDDETRCIVPFMILKPLPQASARNDYRLVVFDFDGTLADRFDWFVKLLNGIAPRYRFRPIAPADRTGRA